MARPVRSKANCRRESIRDAGAGAGLLALALGSLGVVYGDIGTSPLYAFREAILASAGERSGALRAGEAELARGNVLGVLSLILWALIVVVTLKYVVILLRADNNGEGGTLALMALARARSVASAKPPGGRTARHHKRRFVLRRRRDHAGAVGAFGH